MKHNGQETQSRTERTKRDRKKNILSWVYCIATVSYTHLDVYKRQLFIECSIQ